jgi:hypothetical protein
MFWFSNLRIVFNLTCLVLKVGNTLWKCGLLFPPIREYAVFKIASETMSTCSLM